MKICCQFLRLMLIGVDKYNLNMRKKKPKPKRNIQRERYERILAYINRDEKILKRVTDVLPPLKMVGFPTHKSVRD